VFYHSEGRGTDPQPIREPSENKFRCSHWARSAIILAIEILALVIEAGERDVLPIWWIEDLRCSAIE
jgi:hypothetical protein